MSTELGNRLRRIRSQERKTLADFAEQLGVHFQSYRNYEVGSRTAPASLLVALAELGYNPDWLLLGEGPMKRPDVAALAVMCSEALAEVLEELRLGLTELKRARVLAALINQQLAASTVEVAPPEKRSIMGLLEIAA
ncbi:MAG: hypothetical protein CMP06_08290 [Xanthomonadales bacterium]|nr:hypothetical protein [Xanthomonadales bacterium]